MSMQDRAEARCSSSGKDLACGLLYSIGCQFILIFVQAELWSCVTINKFKSPDLKLERPVSTHRSRW